MSQDCKLLGSDAQIIMNVCHWCLQEKPKGQWRNGFWICHGCFPPEGGLVAIRKCDACGGRNKKGAVLNNQFICSDCNVFIGATRTPPSTHGKKKKKKFQPVCFKADQQQLPTQRKKKRKKIVRWVVIITEISYGEL